jgi:hypothetical protein
LQPLIQNSPFASVFTPVLASLTDPLLLFYYLFFPGHDEGLEGCDNTTWGSCAGEWAAVGVLLQGDGNHTNFQATHIGLSARDTGTPSYPQGESRVAMTVSNWALVTKVNDHSLVFTAVGTHGLYLTGGSFKVPQFSPQDFSASSCGAYETPDAESAAENAIIAANEAADHTLEYKVLGASATLLNSFPNFGRSFSQDLRKRSANERQTRRRSTWRCATVREMKDGPSRPVVRFWPQTAASCCRQKRWW